ncbi:hypothetical protein ACFOZ7_09870 [Natribaculum luteum]|uniref:DUF8173 domain-containing protein n=1 Tax=Natribaculum luteum TaxID=1586232 RepID=A0ABD5NZ65_9EURY|nr:hypothetical protein [Natribaculum luteum]
MSRFSARFALVSSITTVTLAVSSSSALAQDVPGPGPGPGPEAVPRFPWFLEGIGAAVLTLIVGGLLIAFVPDYTRRVTDRALEEPGRVFLWGAGISIAVIVVAVVLAITVVGIIVAIPLLIAFALFALVAGEFGYLAAGRLVSDDWLPALGVAALVAAVVGSVPLLGGLVAFGISSVGIGSVVVDYRA